jgi:hypothetical protein
MNDVERPDYRPRIDSLPPGLNRSAARHSFFVNTQHIPSPQQYVEQIVTRSISRS